MPHGAYFSLDQSMERVQLAPRARSVPRLSRSPGHELPNRSVAHPPHSVLNALPRPIPP
jgi:hypothetical protein